MLERLRLKRGSCSSGGVWRTAKRDCTGYCSSTIYCLAPASTGYYSSTVDLLRPPPATVPPRRLPPASTGSCSSSLHQLLFNQPSMGSYSSSLHRLQFNQPSTRGPVQPALHGVLFIHPQPARSGSCSSSGNDLYYHGVLFIQPPTGNCSSTPSTTLTVHPEAASIGFS